MAVPRGLTNAGKGRPPGALNKTTREIRDAARLLLEDADYRASLRRRLIAGTAPHMETLLHHYAYGRPKEMMESGDQKIIIQWGGGDPFPDEKPDTESA